MGHIIFIALGTNQGSRMDNLWRAIEALAPEVRVLKESRVYETPPWGVLEQPRFLNMAVKAETDLTPEELLMHLKRIEKDMGRVATIRNGPRVIDLDILFYDDKVIEFPNLTIPHARLHERAFVLVPLAELAPELVHPVLGTTVRELLEGVNTEGIQLMD